MFVMFNLVSVSHANEYDMNDVDSYRPLEEIEGLIGFFKSL